VLEQLVTRVGVWRTDIKVLLPGFGAMLAGFARERLCGDVVATLRRYHELGGVPDQRMYDTALTACLTAGEVPHFPSCVCLQFHLSHSSMIEHEWRNQMAVIALTLKK
jgi:hypothetical protein